MTDCKCGHYKLSHHYGQGLCAVRGCECKKYRPVKVSQVIEETKK